MDTSLWPPAINTHRPAFLDALLTLLPDPHATHFNKRCTSISTSASGAQCIHFADGTTHEADLIIGADGISSTSRNSVVGTDKKLQFTNTVAYRGLVPMETLREEAVKADLSRRVYNFVGIYKVGVTVALRKKKSFLLQHIIAFQIISGKIASTSAMCPPAH